jgi:hypothetical protein
VSVAWGAIRSTSLTPRGSCSLRGVDEGDTAPAGDVAPDGVAGGALVELGLESHGSARPDDRVVEARSESSELAQVEAGVGDHGPRSCMRAPAGVHNGCLLTDNKPRLLPDVRATTVQQELDQIF